jgi:hypothetical protein
MLPKEESIKVEMLVKCAVEEPSSLCSPNEDFGRIDKDDMRIFDGLFNGS